jgi:uncharacterized protein (DUF1697 family)
MSVAAYVALLRSVNVGGRKVNMKELAALFGEMGYGDVVTYIQSGNVVFTSPSRSAGALERAIEGRIERELGLEVRTLLRSKAELDRVLRANPFLATKAEPAKLHVTFLAAQPGAALMRAAGEFDAGADEFRVVGREVYVHCPNGYGTTKINNTFFEKRLETVATTRNWNTVNKLAELASRSSP